MYRLIAAFALLTAGLFAQPQQVMKYDGSGNLAYICESKNQTSNTTTTWARSDSTITNVVIASNVATVTFGGTITNHQLYVGASLTIAGSTAAVIDGTFTVLSAPSATTVTLGITAANATHTTSTITITTKSPLENAKYWAIQILYYDSSNVYQTARWADKDGHGVKCSERALYR